MDYNKFEYNLVLLLKLFNNRPNHLAKYLIDNDSLTKDFEDLVTNSDNLNNTLSSGNQLDFSSYDEMHIYFNKLIGDNSVENQSEPDPELSKELNLQLFNLLNIEKYEDAVKLRDYMMKKNIKIII
tara:strand:- start:2159 stop:2536 length:378 start_codon:yes stop_codon:yes gene_type:complete